MDKPKDLTDMCRDEAFEIMRGRYGAHTDYFGACRIDGGPCEVWCGTKTGEGDTFEEAIMDFDTMPSNDSL